jgi:cyclohexa-1,5-dienecarbonyl-CoA hydratase
LVEKSDGIGKIILNRAPVNILNIEMMEEINNTLKDFKTDDTLKLVTISSSMKAFSAGVDIKEHTVEKVNQMMSVFHEMFERLDAIEVPVVCIVNGAALGGGCELVAFCDIVIASDKSTFGQPEISVGVFPPIAVLLFLKLVGIKKGTELILTGDIISSEEAKEIGLVNVVLPSEDFENHVTKYLQKFTEKSGIVLKLTKKAIKYCLTDYYRTDLLKSVENIYLNQLMKTDDATEGLTAFMEKRKPIWKDR